MTWETRFSVDIPMTDDLNNVPTAETDRTELNTRCIAHLYFPFELDASNLHSADYIVNGNASNTGCHTNKWFYNCLCFCSADGKYQLRIIFWLLMMISINHTMRACSAIAKKTNDIDEQRLESVLADECDAIVRINRFEIRMI